MGENGVKAVKNKFNWSIEEKTYFIYKKFSIRAFKKLTVERKFKFLKFIYKYINE